jgi:DNA helicase-2/ATP-dependent DNA helicase PcrA
MQLNMYAIISITNDDIKYAEKILFGKENIFDDERKVFIKNLETIDLQAVPGSGKTTALLAKLLIFEKYLPFEDGSGILVLSHTNAAVDEIKNRIGKYCPKLF